MMAGSSLVSIASILTPWAFKVINFKEYTQLSSNIGIDQPIDGEFRVTTFFNDTETWYSYDFLPEIPEIVGHYLNLNLSFIRPTWDFNFTTKQHFIDAILKLMHEEQIDYILDRKILSADLYHSQKILL